MLQTIFNLNLRNILNIIDGHWFASSVLWVSGPKSLTCPWKGTLLCLIIYNLGDFPGGPGVKTLPSIAEGADLIPGQGTKILHASWLKKKPEYKQQKQYCNKFNKDFKNGQHLKKSCNTIVGKKIKVYKISLQEIWWREEGLFGITRKTWACPFRVCDKRLEISVLWAWLVEGCSISLHL